VLCTHARGKERLARFFLTILGLGRRWLFVFFRSFFCSRCAHRTCRRVENGHITWRSHHDDHLDRGCVKSVVVHEKGEIWCRSNCSIQCCSSIEPEHFLVWDHKGPRVGGKWHCQHAALILLTPAVFGMRTTPVVDLLLVGAKVQNLISSTFCTTQFESKMVGLAYLCLLAHSPLVTCDTCIQNGRCSSKLLEARVGWNKTSLLEAAPAA
jgi:hypothetical protein